MCTSRWWRGDVVCEVKRSVVAEVWSTHPGLLPQDMRWTGLSRHCWSAGSVAPNVRMGYKTHNNPTSGNPEDWDHPDMTVVTDENGQEFRFFNMDNSGTTQFIPIPSHTSEQDNFLGNAHGEQSGGGPGFVDIHAGEEVSGTTLTFNPLATPLSYRTNPDSSDPADYQYYYYYRCTQVVDRVRIYAHV